MSNVIMRVDVPQEVKMKVEPALLVKGLSPTIEVTDITGGHRVSITDIDGTQTFDVMNGEKGDPGGSVQDVQVNGVSVLDAQGVANVPIATTSAPGAIAIGSGLSISSGWASVSGANDNQVKAGTATTLPIVPVRQHASAFYGFAKAAGDTTQSQSSNAVGTYTEAAKSAIRNMIGAADGSDYRLIYSVTATDSLTVDINSDLNGDPLSLKSVFILATCPASQAASSGIVVGAYDGSTQKGIGYINTSQSTTEIKRGYCIIDKNHGLWKTEQAGFGTSGIVSINTYTRFTGVLSGQITKVRLSGIIAGYEISVYGY